MNTPQLLSFIILAAMMALFVWGRLRYDMVAVVALLAGLAAGIVPTDKAFSGFSDDIVIIVASALVVSAAVARSGVIEAALRPVAPWLTTPTIQIVVLTAVVAAITRPAARTANSTTCLPVIDSAQPMGANSASTSCPQAS